ncbi:DUF1738 domain-containing protein [Campylobacter jejuni]|nr:DUF1738 domain-containing protein [Campylobacter jejuni]
MKKWNEMNNQEKLESMLNYDKAIYYKAIREHKTPFHEKTSLKDLDKTMPYNALTGKPFTNLDSVKLRTASLLNDFKQNVFLTEKQAKEIGANLKMEIDPETNKEIKPKGVKIAYIADKENNPQVKTTIFYNVSQFENLDKNKIKPLDKDYLKEIRKKCNNLESEIDFSSKIQKLNLHSNTTKSINNLIQAELYGRDFVPNKTYENYQKKDNTLNKDQSRNM